MLINACSLIFKSIVRRLTINYQKNFPAETHILFLTEKNIENQFKKCLGQKKLRSI